MAARQFVVGIEMSDEFKKSQEFAFRRMVREAIKKAPKRILTKAERDITLAILGIWFHHKDGSKQYIHPGRKRLARKAGVTVKTVERCLTKLRSSGALEILANPRGGYHQATQYRVSVVALLSMCDMSIPKMFPGELFEVKTGKKCRTRKSTNVAQDGRQNVALLNKNVGGFDE